MTQKNPFSVNYLHFERVYCYMKHNLKSVNVYQIEYKYISSPFIRGGINVGFYSPSHRHRNPTIHSQPSLSCQ